MTTEDPKTEVPLEAAPAPAAEAPKADPVERLSNRDALEKAIAERRERRTVGDELPKPEAPAEPAAAAKPADERPEPPSEFSGEGKKAWRDGDIAGIQKEYRRINETRVRELSRAQTAEREALEKARPWLDIGNKAKVYIEARGKEGVLPEQAIMEALALVDSFRGEKPETVKAELKKIGIDLDAKSQPGAAPVDPALQDHIKTLLEDKEQRDRERQEQAFHAVASTFNQSITSLAALKNSKGEPLYPGFQDGSEAGLEFAKELGSVTRDPTFRKLVLRRFPDADHTVLVREAYLSMGGKVSGDPVKVSTHDNQRHLERARRAAASTPGRVATRNDSASLVGKLSNRAALERAVADVRGR